MNKTTEALKLAELVEASAEEYMGEDGMVMVIPLDLYNDLIGALAAIREELSDHSGDDYENMTDDELADLQFTRAIAREALAEPVKQEPVAVISESAIGLVKLHSNGACLPFGTQLYAAPVSTEAIRAEALEEAAKWFEGKVGQADLRDIAAAIREMK